MTSTAWLEPLSYAKSLENEDNLVLLYSGMEPGRLSILAWGLEDEIVDFEGLKGALGGAKNQKTDDFGSLKSSFGGAKNKFENCWFGYLGYGLRNQFEDLPKNEESIISLPDLLMMKFKNIMIFDHVTQTVIPAKAGISSCKLKEIPASAGMTEGGRMTGGRGMTIVESNMSNEEYLAKVETVIEKIHAGELYQANLTRKFFGEVAEEINHFDLFCRLCEISPAPYSAYLKFGEHVIISSSPEKFLTVENGIAVTEPIKGTLSSKFRAEILADSEKDKAENLMIVDLMRNDLSKTCRNVTVDKLFEITSYSKYHHMSSTISGECADTTINIVKNCFPPGSMTGAPKIKAIELCSELEGIERGIYSGAIGYFGEDGSCDLAVVIRTLIFKGRKFEFQVGGGIVADSTPESELEEIYVKAKGIFEVLNVAHLSLRA